MCAACTIKGTNQGIRTALTAAAAATTLISALHSFPFFLSWHNEFSLCSSHFPVLFLVCLSVCRPVFQLELAERESKTGRHLSHSLSLSLFFDWQIFLLFCCVSVYFLARHPSHSVSTHTQWSAICILFCLFKFYKQLYQRWTLRLKGEKSEVNK